MEHETFKPRKTRLNTAYGHKIKETHYRYRILPLSACQNRLNGVMHAHCDLLPVKARTSNVSLK